MRQGVDEEGGDYIGVSECREMRETQTILCSCPAQAAMGAESGVAYENAVERSCSYCHLVSRGVAE